MAIETILLAIGSNDEKRVDELTEAVLEVAVPTGAEVVIAHVFDDDEFDRLRDRLKDREDEDPLEPDEVALRHSTVRAFAEALEEAGVRPEIRGEVGDRGSTVVAFAEEYGADRIVIGGRERSPAGKAIFGSTAQEILLSSPCPVTFVRSA